MPALSPRIDALRWGSVEVEGGLRFKDAKLFPGGAREWDWNETGTRHSPGIQLADVQELLDRGAHVIILSRGQRGQLKVPPETCRALEDLGAEVTVLESKPAVELYNQLASQAAVGALIHSTC